VIPPDAILPGVPSHPIWLPAYPDNTLPGEQPKPDNTLPGEQPKPDQGLPKPPKPDTKPPKPDQGLPPFPSHPIVFPPGLPEWPETPGLPPLVPAHPIVIPPGNPPQGAIVIMLPPTTEGTPPPPEGIPVGSVQAILWFGPGTLPVQVWIPPYGAQLPIK